jgi:hypothetical protein
MVSSVTWPIGIMPIAWFLHGILELVRILLLDKEPTQNTVGAFMGFVPGVVVIIAWLVGYRDPSDHALWKFLALSGMGALVWLLLRFGILQNSKYGEKMKSDMLSLGSEKLGKNLLLAVSVFLLVCITFSLAEHRLQNPQPCTRITCEEGIILIGSQYSSLGFLWFFSFFTTMFPAGLIITLSALIQLLRNK